MNDTTLIREQKNKLREILVSISNAAQIDDFENADSACREYVHEMNLYTAMLTFHASATRALLKQNAAIIVTMKENGAVENVTLDGAMVESRTKLHTDILTALNTAHVLRIPQLGDDKVLRLAIPHGA